MDAFPLLSYIEAARERDTALTRVKENNGEWLGIAMAQLRSFAKHPETTGWGNLSIGFIGEDLRAMLMPRCGKPASPAVWGEVDHGSDQARFN